MKLLKLFIFILLIVFACPSKGFAFWIWTPETNKWVNPKYAVKETPQEQLAFAMESLEAKNYKQAIKEFEKLLKHYPRAKEAPEAQYYIGLTQEEQGDSYKAFKSYQLVVDRYPFSERSSEIVQRQFDIGLKLLEGKQNQNKFVEALSGADYDVIDIFKAVIKNAPYGDLAPQAQYKIGLYLMEKRLYQEARDEFEKLMSDYPDSDWARAAKYQIALTDAKRSTGAEYDQKVTKSAVDEFEEFLEAYPQADLTGEAKKEIQKLRDKEAKNSFVVAQFYEKQKNYNAAKIYYRVVVDDYSDTIWAKKALTKIQELTDKVQ